MGNAAEWAAVSRRVLPVRMYEATAMIVGLHEYHRFRALVFSSADDK